MTEQRGGASQPLTVRDAAAMPLDAVFAALGCSERGLSNTAASAERERVGPNAVRTHQARPAAVLARQVRSPLMALLIVTAVVSFFLGDRNDALIIGAILGISIVLGFVNEYRAERAAQALHQQMRRTAVVRRDGSWSSCDVTDVVPGDLVQLQMGQVVPADLRIVTASNLECDESMLTGEAMPVEKTPDPVTGAVNLGDLSSCAFMGTIVSDGEGEGVVVATGASTEFGAIAVGLGERQAQTEFQVGLNRFSMLLAIVAGVLTSSIFVTNLVLGRPFIDALLFSLAIAVGITPQLLPAVVTTSLATGSRRLAERKVLVKRLVCIEDLGDLEVLLTDKTGTLTEGRITFERAFGPDGTPSADALLYGLLSNEASLGDGGAVGGNPLDLALWDAPGAPAAPVASFRRVAVAPFDHNRRRVSVLVDGPKGRVLVTKGAPEGVLERCHAVPSTVPALLDRELANGGRVVAVATRDAPDLTTVTPDDEHDLALVGFLVFLDQPKASARGALARLNALGITVRIVTGDHPKVAEKVCDDLGLPPGATLTGTDLDALDDDQLAARLATTRIYARVSPEQKTRLILAYRHAGTDVAYLGDGVNDAVALHKADVGISVDSATDVAKDAADIVLLEKDLGVLANGVEEGRRTFANTIKYVLMGTSSNFGNMFSAAAASAFLRFLPMLPSQILLNNLLYDSSQMTIPTDRVDAEQLARPSHWDIAFIRRFMLFFGPISSLFDFLTFAIMLHVFDAGPRLFRSGWFVESLATQTLVIFVIRTRRVPFFRSRASKTMVAASTAVVLVGAYLPFSPLSHDLGFRHLPFTFFVLLVVLVLAYLVLAEVAKWMFYGRHDVPIARERPAHVRRVERRAASFTQGGPLT